MIELPGKLSKEIDKVLKASEVIRIDREMLTNSQSQDQSTEAMPAESVPATESITSPAILNRLAQEGSGSQAFIVAQEVSGKGKKGGKSAKSAKSGKGASFAMAADHAKNAKSAKSAKSAKLDKNRPLSEQEKVELLYILQQSDPSYTMAEINALLDGIASGEIDKVSNGSLRKVIETAKKYGVDVVVDGLTPPPAGPSDPAAGGGRGVDFGAGEGDHTVPPPPWVDEAGTQGAGSGTVPGDVSGELGELDDALEAVDAVQEELEEVKQAIAEVREVIRQIHHFIGVFRLSGAFSENTLPQFRMSKEMVLIQAVKQEAQETERTDTQRFVEARFRAKEVKEDEDFADLAAAQHWSREILGELDPEGRQNPEAPIAE